MFSRILQGYGCAFNFFEGLVGVFVPCAELGWPVHVQQTCENTSVYARADILALQAAVDAVLNWGLVFLKQQQDPFELVRVHQGFGACAFQIPRLVTLKASVLFEVGLPFSAFCEFEHEKFLLELFVGVFAGVHPDGEVIVDDALADFEAVKRGELCKDIVHFEGCR